MLALSLALVAWGTLGRAHPTRVGTAGTVS
jgi:hypothetical protein